MKVMYKIEATIELTVPDGATHYSGDLLDDPLFFKMTVINEQEHWWWFGRLSKEWKLQGHSKPHWLKELSSEVKLEFNNLEDLKELLS